VWYSISDESTASILPEEEEIQFSKYSVLIYKTTWHHTPQDWNHNISEIEISQTIKYWTMY
jgi:hypothetical protein